MTAKRVVLLVSADEARIGAFLQPSHNEDALMDIVDSFWLFALHPSQPYADLFIDVSGQHMRQMGPIKVGQGVGFPMYMTQLQGLYPPNYLGPFIIGVWWKDADTQSTSGED